MKPIEPSRPEWQDFLESNAHLVEESRLSETILACIEHWEDFLKHGYLDLVDDPNDLIAEDLDDESYDALLKLTTAYFETGAPFFVPIALRRDDYMRLTRTFANLTGPAGD